MVKRKLACENVIKRDTLFFCLQLKYSRLRCQNNLMETGGIQLS